MSQVRDAIGEAYVANVAFVKSMAETRAISPEPDLAAMTEGVKALSRDSTSRSSRSSRPSIRQSSNSVRLGRSAAGRVAGRRGSVQGRDGGHGQGDGDCFRALNVYGKDSSEAEQMTAKMFKAVGEEAYPLRGLVEHPEPCRSDGTGTRRQLRRVAGGHRRPFHRRHEAGGSRHVLQPSMTGCSNRRTT